MRRASFILFLLPTNLATADSKALVTALDAARKREETLKSVSIAWKLTVFAPRGGRMDPDPTGLPLPRNDITAESIHRLTIDGNRHRAVHDNPTWRANSLGPVDGIFVHDGNRLASRIYLDGRDRPSILVLHEPAPNAITSGQMDRPLAIWCRWPAGAAGDKELKPTNADDGEVVIDGVRFTEVRVRSRSGKINIYVVDPNMGHLVRRLKWDDDKSTSTIDIEYQKHPTVGWVPKAWTFVRTRPTDKVIERARAEVTDVRINEPVPEDRFVLEPIPGERVSDHQTQKTYTVLADGTLQEADLSGTGSQTTEPRPKRTLDWPGLAFIKYLFFGGLILVLITAVVLRRRHKQLPNTPSP